MITHAEPVHAVLLRQQGVLARFGQLALRSDDLDEVLTEACRLVGDALGTDLARVVEFKDKGNVMLVRAGVGWKAGVVGEVIVKLSETTSEGIALKTGLPMTSADIGTEARFTYTSFLTDNGVQAMATVLIIGVAGQPPFGALQIDSRTPRQFSDSDVSFLQNYANLIAAAVDRLRIMDALREREARLRLGLEAGALGSWEIDLLNGHVSGSARTRVICGYDKQPTVWNRRHLLQLVVPEDRKRVFASFRRAVRSGSPWLFECRILRPGDRGVRWIEGRGRLEGRLNGSLPTRMHGVVADVTARRQNEDALRHSQKMEAVGQLTGGIAHDFNNLLTIISGSLELLRMDLDIGVYDEIRQYTSVAYNASIRAAGLTQRLLAFARRQPLAPRTTDPHELVLNMEDLIRQTVGQDILVEFVTRSDQWTVHVDTNQLENALLNLCANARDAMPQGGKLIIETSNLVHREIRGQASAMLPGRYATISVTDTGQGMSPDVAAHAFEPFFTTKPKGVGTGLGLSMVHGFAHQSGGQVRIKSVPKIGTTVTLYLPGQKDQGVAIKDVESEKLIPVSANGLSVLIVDDVPEIRSVIARTLSRLGYQTIEAANGVLGLEALQGPARIDLLITDVGMPGGLNGLELADAARMARPGLQVLFVTGYAEGLVIAERRSETAAHVLAKPFALTALAAAVSNLVSDVP